MTASRRALPRIGLTFTVLLLAATAVVSSARADTKEELASARAKLNSLEQRIAQANDELAAIQGEANAVAQNLGEVQARLATTQERAAELRREVRAAEARLGGLLDQLDERAREAYTNGAASSLDVLLGSDSFAEFSAAFEFLGRTQQRDADLVNQVENQKARLAIKQIEVRKLENQLDASRRVLVGQQKVLQQKLSSASRILDGLRADQAEAEGLVQKLADRRERELAAARLADLSHSHSPTPISGPAPISGPGPFSVCPVDQPRAYGNDFGAPRSGGRTHQGNDIFAPTGTPIRAPFSGNAVDASNSVGGLSVTVYGSQGYVYNAHLSRMGQLGSVSAGTIIGYVGNSGNAAGTSPHDHFEWHPGNGSAVNPYPYLNQVC